MKSCCTALVIILCALFFFQSPAAGGEDLVRALFVSVIQDPPVLSSRESIDALVEYAKKARVKILFVQIYYANKAWFASKIADPGPYEACLKNVSEDPLALLIKKAHESGIEVHAWLNMLSLNNNKDSFLLKKYGTGILTRNRKEKHSVEDYMIDHQYFLEPGDMRVRAELCDIVGEVLQAYPGLDGVQFDYIRYPDTKPAYGYTEANIERFKAAMGCIPPGECSKAWKDWKRSQVTELLAALAEKAHSVRPGIRVSATGCMPYVRAYYEAFQDWPSWLDRGLVDFVTIMNYSSSPSEFERWIVKTKTRVADFKKVSICLPAYKLVNSSAVFDQELCACERSGCGGYVVFHYGSLLEDPALAKLLSEPR